MRAHAVPFVRVANSFRMEDCTRDVLAQRTNSRFGLIAATIGLSAAKSTRACTTTGVCVVVVTCGVSAHVWPTTLCVHVDLTLYSSCRWLYAPKSLIIVTTKTVTNTQVTSGAKNRSSSGTTITSAPSMVTIIHSCFCRCPSANSLNLEIYCHMRVDTSATKRTLTAVSMCQTASKQASK